MLGSPKTESGPNTAQPLFSKEQRAQVRQMERRAPLLYGVPGGQGRGETSSGGSTAEAVQEEVRRQLRGVMDELAESRREAGSLRAEVERLRNKAETPPTVMPRPEGLPRVFGGYLVDGNGTAMSMGAMGASGLAPTSLSMPQVSGSASTSLPMPGVSGAAPTSLLMPGVSGAAPTSLPMPGVSGSAPTSLPMRGGVGRSTYISDYSVSKRGF